MPTNYRRGVAYEYKAMKALEADGYQVVRSAGSHGEWDVIGFKPGEPVRCIQVKRTTSELSMKRLLKAFKPTVMEGWSPWRSELWVGYKGKWHTSLEGIGP